MATSTQQLIAEHHGDHDGKSKTSSAVDEPRYPDFTIENTPEMAVPTEQEIAQRAHRLWELRGCPAGTAQQDWFEAEQELLENARDRSTVAHIHSDAGSVQK
jgi:hypothetical protein